MDPLEKLPISKEEQALLKKIAGASVAICIVVIIAAVAIPRLTHPKKQGETKNALTALSEKLQGENSGTLLPIDIEAHEWAADYFQRIDNPQKAIAHLKRILPQKSTNRKIVLQLATAYLQALQYADAYELLKQLVDAGARDEIADSATARLGLALFYLGRIDDSRALLLTCLAQGKKSAEAACYLGQVEAAIDPNSKKAEEYFLNAISWDKLNAEAWYQLARYYMATGNYEKSRTHLLQVIEMQPLYVKAYSRLGMAYYYLNQPDLAEKSYQTALTLNPDDGNTHYNLGELYYSLYNDPKRALIEFKKTLQDDPSHIEANFKVGLICLANSMDKEASQYLSKARDGDPHNTRIILQLGVAYEKIGLKSEALESYRSILSYDPLNEVALQKVKLLADNHESTVGDSKPGTHDSGASVGR